MASMYTAVSDRDYYWDRWAEEDAERREDERLQAEMDDDEWLAMGGVDGLPEPSMEDERRALAVAAELDYRAAQSEPESELEMLRRGVGRQQGELFPREVYKVA